MKIFFTLICLSILSFAGAQRHQLGLLTSFDSPIKSVMPGMSGSIGTGLNYSYRPFLRIPLHVELKSSSGLYAYRTLNQTFQFSNGSTTQTNVDYKSALRKTLVGVKLYSHNEYRMIRGFITPQIGIAGMKTKIRIADPQDVDDCRPLENKTTKGDFGVIYGGEIGLELAANTFLKKAGSEGNMRFYISASYINSFKQFDYVNIKHMKNGGNQMDMDMKDDSRDLNTTFINVSSNSLHEHKIAELYQTNLNMIGINCGIIFNF
jgi:hypothetical protein